MAQTRLRAALIGVGAWGRVLAKAAGQSAKIEFVCCVGRDPQRLAIFARETGLLARAFEDVLADTAIDAVVLALPNELHLDFAQRAARFGKHIYMRRSGRRNRKAVRSHSRKSSMPRRPSSPRAPGPSDGTDQRQKTSGRTICE